MQVDRMHVPEVTDDRRSRPVPNFISEEQIERAILEKLQRQFGFEVLNCHTADHEDLNHRSNRSDKRDVIFSDRLKEAAVRLNPTIPEALIDTALAQLTDKRRAMSPIGANREIDGLIRDSIFTFVVVTAREDLDGQIFRNFLNSGTVRKHEVARPGNSGEMRKFLGQNKRIVFTLIQKFRYDRGKDYPLLSDRDDLIVMVDEAHRTQYKSLAENIRRRLPNAQYLAFTGTPVHPREVFADPIADRASAIILSHNHPSGDFNPSTEDILLTRQLEEAGETFGITVLDRIIFSRKGH